MRDLEERDAIREQYADRSGISGQVEALMGARENAEAYDAGTDGIDKQLAEFGYTARSKREAAEKRKAAAEQKPAAEEPVKQAPQGRRAPARQTGADAGG